VLFAVIFLWTPPHFWALAMKFRKDYAAANIPMLPVVASPATVVRKILWYSYAMVAATLALVPYAGWIYGVFAAALGVWFLAEAHRLNARVTAVPAPAGPSAAQAAPFTGATAPVTAEAGPGPVTAQAGAAASGPSPAPMRLFHLSIAYLTLLFAAVAVTALLPWGRW
jgi:protoheme IX farnesyltransferase